MSRNPRPLESLLLPLKPESLQSAPLSLIPELGLTIRCLHRFMQHEPEIEKRRFPRKRTAAVAIMQVQILNKDSADEADCSSADWETSMFCFLRMFWFWTVLTSRRAGDMRTYAQDTALPGGKYEEGDVDSEGTAVGLVILLRRLN